MKTPPALALAAVLLAWGAGCAPAASPAPTPTREPTNTPLPPPANTPTPEPDFGPWQPVRELTYRDSSNSVNNGVFHDESFGVLVGAGGHVETTTDGAQEWSVLNANSMCLFGADIVDENVVWICGNMGHVRLSQDGGKTWKAVTGFGASEPNHCRYLSFLDDTTGWAATQKGQGFTSDGATAWTELALPAGAGQIAAVFLRTPADGYVLDDSGTLHATADGGATWISRPVNAPGKGKLPIDFAPIAAVRFRDAERGRIVLLRNGYWTGETSDGGATWTWTAMPDFKGARSFYMTRDGRLLTSIDIAARSILLLEYSGA